MVSRASGFPGVIGQWTRRRAGGALDLDGDGKPERLHYHWTGGSGFGGLQISVRPGNDAAPLDMDLYGSFGAFLTAAPLAAAWGRAPTLVLGVLGWLFGPAALRTLAYSPRGQAKPSSATPRPAPAQGSFEWLVDWHLWPALPRRAPFVECRAFTPRWSPGPPVAPRTQAAWVAAPLALRLVKAMRPGDTSGLSGSRRAAAGALLAYYAGSHVALRRAQTCGAWTLYVTRHGVALYDHVARRSFWAFLPTEVQ